MSQQEAVLLLGSNIGNTKQNLLEALSYLEKEAGRILAKSKFLQTKPLEFASFNNFHNFAVILNTHLSPIQLLLTIKQIEKKMGRQKDSKSNGKYEDRIIDIDIVKYSNLLFKCSRLEIPHFKHMFEREFSKELLDDLSTKKT